MARLLVADDEEGIRELVRRYAEREGHEVLCAADGVEAVHLASEHRPDAAILDVMMPELDGYRACREMRMMGDIPVILLTARGDEYDRLFGFEVGADDYVVKPFSPKELMARLNVVLRRTMPKREDPACEDAPHEHIRQGSLTIDLDAHEVFVEGSRVELTAKEYDVLVYLARHPRIALTRTAILSAVWGYEAYGEDRTVDWQVKLLRSKLGPCRAYIKTIRGVGYKFDVE